MLRACCDDLTVCVFNEDFTLLASRGGARRLLSGPEALLIHKLVEAVGIDGLAPILAEPAESAPLRHMISVPSPTERPVPLSVLLADAPSFVAYAETERMPLIGMIEVTPRCNLRCRHCYLLPTIEDNRSVALPESAVFETIRCLVELGCLNVTLTGGEATLTRQFFDYVGTCKSAGLYTIVKTNGSTFTRARAERYALDPGHETHVSLYGSSPGVHEAFTATRGSFARTVRGLRELARVGITCLVSCIVWSGNVRQLREIRQLVSELGHSVSLDDVIYGRHDGDKGPLKLRASNAALAQAERDGYLARQPVAPCVAGRVKVKVGSDGGVSACELLPFSIGNVNDTPLSVIWRSSAFAIASDRVIAASKQSVPDMPSGRRCPGLDLLMGVTVLDEELGHGLATSS